MKRLMVGVMSSLTAVAAFGFDWPSGGTVIVPAGETYVATEADMAKVNALTSITIEGAVEGDEPKAAGVLEFQSCATAPKAGLLLGEGVVRKVGIQEWTLTGDNADFGGDFRICGGKVITRTASAFGKTDKTCKGAVYVESGATLAIDSTSVKFCYRAVHISGTGTGTTSADKALSVVTSDQGCLALLYLDADATVDIGTGANVYWVGTQGRPFGDKNDGSQIHTEGHVLTLTGAATRWYYLGLTVLGGGRIVVGATGKALYYSNGADFGDALSEPFETADQTSFYWYNTPTPIARPLQADGALTVDMTSNESTENKFAILNTNTFTWAGDVVLNGASSSLNSRNSFSVSKFRSSEGRLVSHDVQFSFLGDISGEGSVTVGHNTAIGSRSGWGRTYFGGHNTYTGTTTVFGSFSTRLYAAYWDSIPDYSKTTIDSGYVAARLGTDGENEFWPVEKIYSFLNSANYRNMGAFALDASGCEGGVCEFAAKDLLANVTRPEFGFGVAGGTVRITAEEDDVLPLCPCAFRGTLELTGNGVFRTVGTNVIHGVSGWHSNTCEVVVKGGATVEQGVLPVYVGQRVYRTDPDNQASPGQLTVKDGGKWMSTATEYPSGTTEDAYLAGGLVVGYGAAGVLNICDGGVVSNKLYVGGGRQSNTYSYGDGGVYVGNGGRLFMVSALGANWPSASLIGAYGYGYLQVEPGATVEAGDPKASTFVIGGYGPAIVHLYGGIFRKTGGCALASAGTDTMSPDAGGHGDVSADLYVKDGTFKLGTYMSTCAGTKSTVLIAVDGPGARIEQGSAAIYPSQNKDSQTVICMNDGGVITADRINPYPAATNGVERHPVVVTFNGGVLERVTKTYDFVGNNPRGLEFAIYEKGATFDFGDDITYDSAGHTIDPVCPLAGRVAGGVKAVDATDAVAYRGWIGAPKVRILSLDGNGGGAAAVADWDWQKRELKGIRILSPGWGYTPGQVKVVVSTRTKWVTIDGDKVTVGDNEIGGLTKKGNGTFLIQSTNSWQKWTQIDGAGAIKVGGAYAIPANTELRLNGGTLDLNGYDADEERATTFCGVAGTGGTVKNGNLRIVGDWKVSARRFLDRVTTAVAGTVDLTDCTGVTITDTELLDDEAAKEKALNLMTATTVVLPDGGIAVSGLPDGWKASLSENGLRMGPQKGLLLIFH